jgi:predicted nucleic acid-binding protein
MPVSRAGGRSGAGSTFVKRESPASYAPSHGLDDIDALTAATAGHHGLRLATRNAKHFPMFSEAQAGVLIPRAGAPRNRPGWLD